MRLWGYLAALFICLVLSPVSAQQHLFVTAPAGLTGVTQVNAGGEVLIYSVELADILGDGTFIDLGNATIGGIQVTIEDLSTPTGVTSADFSALSMYQSADALFDAGDTFMASNSVVNVGAATTIDVTGLPIGGLRRLPTFAATTWFLITANISPAATSGHAFRLSATNPHIGFDESGGAPVDTQDGAAIISADANSIVLNAQQAMKISGGAVTIPFGGEPIILILLVGSSLYMMRRRDKSLSNKPV